MNITSLNLPLKEMDELLLAAEITERADELGFGPMVREAITLAAYAHSGQSRANRGRLPRDTYVTHPLRNALRLLRYGVVRDNIIIGEILHDTVEDAAEKLYELMRIVDSPRLVPLTPAEYREAAFQYITRHFGVAATAIVHGMTNPLPDPVASGIPVSRNQKRADYLAHLIDAIRDPEVAVGKASDLVDNGAGLYHNTTMVDEAFKHLARKYAPALKVMIVRVQSQDVIDIMTENGAKKLVKNLEEGLARLEAVVDGS